jgi:tetratricopeptide (TPR) repeat protein
MLMGAHSGMKVSWESQRFRNYTITGSRPIVHLEGKDDNPQWIMVHVMALRLLCCLYLILRIGLGSDADANTPYAFGEASFGAIGYTSNQLEQASSTFPDLMGVPPAYGEVIESPVIVGGTGSGTARNLVNKGNGLLNQNKYDEALQAYNKAIELNPQYEEAWIGKALTFIVLGRTDEALEAFDKVTELNPLDAKAWNIKGELLNILGKSDKALQTFDKAIELNPQDALAWLSKGNLLLQLNRYDEALQTFDRATELDPQNTNAWKGKGLALNKLNRDDEALEAFDKATKTNPQNAGRVLILLN